MKQSYASLVASVFFLGVHFAASTQSVQESLSQAFSMNREGSSSWGELGLGGDDLNLQVIESSLMSMVKEGTSPSLRPGIMAIYNLTNDMMASVVNHSSFQQDKLNQSWNSWVQCSADDGARNERFEYLRTILTECQLNHSSYWDCQSNCTKDCEVTANQTEELRKLYCLTDPHNCEMQVQALDDNRAVKNQIISLRAHFNGRLNPSVDCNGTTPNCTTQCQWTCQETVTVGGDNCTTDVCSFEEAGCHAQHDACRVYNDCYVTGQEEYLVTLGEVQSDDDGSQHEYRAILRIQCLLNAFLGSIDDVNGTGLDEGINYCINRTYHQYHCKCNSCPLSSLQDTNWNAWLGSNATYPEDNSSCSNNYERDATSTGCDYCSQPYIPIFVTYPDVSTNPKKNCTSAMFPGLEPTFDIVPGTQQWTDQYYSHWPADEVVPSCELSLDICNVNATWNGINEPNLTSHMQDLDSSNPYVR